MASIHFYLLAIILSITGTTIPVPASAKGPVPHVLLPFPANAGAAARVPPLLAAARPRLSLAAAAKTAARIEGGQGLAPDLAGFCARAGFLCNQTVARSSPLQLFALTEYGPPCGPNDSHHHPADELMKVIRGMDGLFFAQSELAMGNQLRLSNPLPPTALRAFLPPPLQKALAPLFSLRHAPQMLRLFGYSADSSMASNVRDALAVCERAPGNREAKACVSSLEEMLSFAASLLGTGDLEALVGPNYFDLPAVDARVDAATEVGASTSGAVACHNLMFPYQVFYCHHLQGSKVFKVILGTHRRDDHLQRNALHALASCHDLLQHRGLKPPNVDSAPQLICHWNFGDNIVWIPRQALRS